MRNWRILTAVTAVVLAVLAGVLVWQYTEDAQSEAKKPFTFENVLVASQRVPIGTSLTAAIDGGLVTRAQRVRNDLPQGAILGSASDSVLKTQYADKVASHDITADQTLTSGDFVAPNTLPNGLAGQLETDGKNDSRHVEAVTVEFNESSSVGGFLTPGDKVNIWVTSKVTPKTDGDEIDMTTWLLPGVKVLAVGAETGAPSASTSSTNDSSNGSNSDQSANRPSNRALITLEATTEQVEQIIHAKANGNLYLSLNPPSFNAGDFSNPEEIVEGLNLYRVPGGGARRELPVLEEWARKQS